MDAWGGGCADGVRGEVGVGGCVAGLGDDSEGLMGRLVRWLFEDILSAAAMKKQLLLRQLRKRMESGAYHDD